MNKATLASALYEKRCDDIKTKAAAERIVSDIFDCIADGVVEDGEARFVGFGTFQVVKRKARKGTDPQTKKAIKIPATKAVRFKPSADLKARAAKSKGA